MSVDKFGYMFSGLGVLRVRADVSFAVYFSLMCLTLGLGDGFFAFSGLAVFVSRLGFGDGFFGLFAGSVFDKGW